MCGCWPSASAKLEPGRDGLAHARRARCRKCLLVVSARERASGCGPGAGLPPSMAASWPVKSRRVLEADPAVDLRGATSGVPAASAARPALRGRARCHRAHASTSRPCSRKRRISAPWLVGLGAPPAQHAPRVGDLVLEDRHRSQSWSATTAITSSSVVSPCGHAPEAGLLEASSCRRRRRTAGSCPRRRRRSPCAAPGASTPNTS